MVRPSLLYVTMEYSGLPFDILLIDILTTVLTYRTEAILTLASNSELGGIDAQPMITSKLSAEGHQLTPML